PENRFATAREMALAIQREVGTVAPCEVGDWVSELAEEHLSTRSRYLAELERLAMTERESGATRGSSAPPPAMDPSEQTSLSAVTQVPPVGAAPSSVIPLTATFDGYTDQVAFKKRLPARLLLVTGAGAIAAGTWFAFFGNRSAASSPFVPVDQGPAVEAT